MSGALVTESARARGLGAGFCVVALQVRKRIVEHLKCSGIYVHVAKNAAVVPVRTRTTAVAGELRSCAAAWKSSSSSWIGYSRRVSSPSSSSSSSSGKMAKYVKRSVVNQAVSVETDKEVEYHLNIAKDVTQV